MNTQGSNLSFKDYEDFVLKLKVKLPSGLSQIRRIRLPRLIDSSGGVSYEELVGLCIEFTFPGSSPELHEVSLTYFDEDQDAITIASSNELMDAIEQFSKVKVLRIATEVKRKVCTEHSEAAVTSEPPRCHERVPSFSSTRGGVPSNPQVKNVLDSFVGVLSKAVTQLQQGLATSSLDSSSTERARSIANPSTVSAPKDSGNDQNIVEAFVHFRHTCDGCHVSPIVGQRFRAMNRQNYDLCATCHKAYTPPTDSNAITLVFEEAVDNVDRKRQQQKRVPETAEAQERPFIHGRHTCDSCLCTPIIGKRFHAVSLKDYDLCENCHSNHTGSDVRFQVEELDRDRPFQARWRRRREKFSRLEQRRASLLRRHPGAGRRGPHQMQEARHRLLSVKNEVPRVIDNAMGSDNSKEEVTVSGSGANPEVDSALREAIRRSLQDVAPEDTKTKSTNQEGNVDVPAISVEHNEIEDSTLTDAETQAMEDAMEVESVDSEKMIADDDRKPAAIPLEKKVSSGSGFSKDESFESEAAGSGDVAEAVGATLDLFAGMISDMLTEPEIINTEAKSDESGGKVNLEEADQRGALITNASSTAIDPEENSWQVVEGNDDGVIVKEDIARATEMLGSVLFNSSSQESDDKISHEEDVSSRLDDSLSLPSSVPSINVSTSQRARWFTYLEQLKELGFDNEAQCIEILERLQAANIGVEAYDDISLTQVVNNILEQNH